MEAKKKEVEEQTGKILIGQNKLGEQRRKVQDIKAQLLQLTESKKAAVTGMFYIVKMADKSFDPRGGRTGLYCQSADR